MLHCIGEGCSVLHQLHCGSVQLSMGLCSAGNPIFLSHVLLSEVIHHWVTSFSTFVSQLTETSHCPVCPYRASHASLLMYELPQTRTHFPLLVKDTRSCCPTWCSNYKRLDDNPPHHLAFGVVCTIRSIIIRWLIPLYVCLCLTIVDLRPGDGDRCYHCFPGKGQWTVNVYSYVWVLTCAWATEGMTWRVELTGKIVSHDPWLKLLSALKTKNAHTPDLQAQLFAMIIQQWCAMQTTTFRLSKQYGRFDSSPNNNRRPYDYINSRSTNDYFWELLVIDQLFRLSNNVDNGVLCPVYVNVCPFLFLVSGMSVMEGACPTITMAHYMIGRFEQAILTLELGFARDHIRSH